jgi:hypothetical protein
MNTSDLQEYRMIIVRWTTRTFGPCVVALGLFSGLAGCAEPPPLDSVMVEPRGDELSTRATCNFDTMGQYQDFTGCSSGYGSCAGEKRTSGNYCSTATFECMPTFNSQGQPTGYQWERISEWTTMFFASEYSCVIE